MQAKSLALVALSLVGPNYLGNDVPKVFADGLPFTLPQADDGCGKERARLGFLVVPGSTRVSACELRWPLPGNQFGPIMHGPPERFSVFVHIIPTYDGPELNCYLMVKGTLTGEALPPRYRHWLLTRSVAANGLSVSYSPQTPGRYINCTLR